MSEREGPKMRDSDVIYLVIKRLEQVASKMTRFEYDQALEDLMNECAEIFDWLTENIANRDAEATS